MTARIIEILAVLALVLLLAGCQTDDVGPTALVPICSALVGPIKYNSTNKNSLRYAARNLVPDLKQRNQIGERLGCTNY